jgi:putative tryptophan/tyrosine transport system substrate-binding protein
MTSRREFLFAGTVGALAPAHVLAQQKTVRVGVLSPRSLSESSYAPHLVRRLEELGFRPGSTMALEYRSTDGVVERFAPLARELIDRRCDIIFALGLLPTQALRDARAQMPVVFLAIEGDPIRQGLVSNLRRPEGNFTGVYIPQEAMVGKRFEVLREVMPVRRLLVLVDPAGKALVEIARRYAELAGIDLTIVQFSRPPYDFEGAFAQGLRAKVEAAMLLDSPRFSNDRVEISALLLKHRLPSTSYSVQHVQAGILMSFSANQSKAARRTAELGVQILRGAKAADIPVEQADEFELSINAKTARALGVKMPESVLARATRIVQ